jgi:hypothetical protein
VEDFVPRRPALELPAAIVGCAGLGDVRNEGVAEDGRQLAVIDAVNTSGFNGWLDQRPLSGANCTQATPPPNIGGSPP